MNGSEVTGKEVISTEAITPMIVAGNLVNVQVEYVGVSQPTLNNAPQDQKKIPHEEAREITKTQTIHHTENTPTWKRLVHQTDSPMRVSNTISNNSGSKRGQPGIEMMKKRRGKKRKNGDESHDNFVKRWRLRCSPVEINENPKLELPGTWEPTCSGCPLSHCEGKNSQNFVSHGNTTIS